MKLRNTSILIGLLVLGACGQSDSELRVLSHELLIEGGELGSQISLSEFAPPIKSRSASNSFSGRLALDTTTQDHQFVLNVDELDLITPDRPGIEDLPEFSFEFVQDGELLIPVTVGPVLNKHGWWEFVLGTGAVWDEDGDHGWSRASLPFALKERREDCIQNGLMSFLFRDTGEVSNVAFQIVNQTCRYLQFEMRGLLAASYAKGDVQGADELIAAERLNRNSRVPVRPVAELSNAYPGASASAFGSTDEIEPEDMSVYGFIIDGVHYVGDCGTLYGDYPYCDEMFLPSYSTAKSLVGGLGLMLLEAAYPGAANTSIGSLVPECDDGWDDVTIEHALDMTTGHFGQLDMHGDEDGEINGRFFASDHAGKIDVACNGFPRKSDPGLHLSYHTWDTYLAGVAMNSLLRKNRGGDADFFDDLLVEQVWKPLGLSRAASVTRRTYDDVRQPYTGFGLTLQRDDIAKLALFIGKMDGRLDDGQLLDRRLFDAIKQRNPDDPGMVAELETIRYNNGFRSFDVSSYLGCEEPAWVVVLSGFGGIIVAIMPNDTTYYYFSDGNVQRYLAAVRESHSIRPMCGKQ